MTAVACYAVTTLFVLAVALVLGMSLGHYLRVSHEKAVGLKPDDISLAYRDNRNGLSTILARANSQDRDLIVRQVRPMIEQRDQEDEQRMIEYCREQFNAHYNVHEINWDSFIDAIDDVQFWNFQWAKSQGFIRDKKDVVKAIALLHTEPSELLEHIREGAENLPDEKCPDSTRGECEIADIILRALHIASVMGWYGVGEAIQEKCEYNATRPFRNGKTC